MRFGGPWGAFRLVGRGKVHYHLMIRTHRRTSAFASAFTVGRTLNEFLRVAEAEQVAVLAYCFLPDQLDVLAECRDARADPTSFVTRATQASGYIHRRLTGSPLWHDTHRLRRLPGEEAVKALACELLHEPVRAGLVARATDYPHLGSAVWSLDQLLEGR